jgi:Ca2+-binding EF-hand superfamily protein
MIGETGPLSFTLFLTLMGERVQGGDAEADILEAFEQFDERNTGMLSLETLRSILTTGQDKMTSDEVQQHHHFNLICC